MMINCSEILLIFFAKFFFPIQISFDLLTGVE